MLSGHYKGVFKFTRSVMLCAHCQAPCAESWRFRLENERKTFRDNSVQKVFHTHTHSCSFTPQIFSWKFSGDDGEWFVAFHSCAFTLSVGGALGCAKLSWSPGAAERLLPPLLFPHTSAFSAVNGWRLASRVSRSISCHLCQRIKKFYDLVPCFASWGSVFYFQFSCGFDDFECDFYPCRYCEIFAYDLKAGLLFFFSFWNGKSLLMNVSESPFVYGNKNS